jgi:hypothetical protein
MVGTTRFELATSPTPRVRSTRLSHVPTRIHSGGRPQTFELFTWSSVHDKAPKEGLYLRNRNTTNRHEPSHHRSRPHRHIQLRTSSRRCQPRRPQPLQQLHQSMNSNQYVQVGPPPPRHSTRSWHCVLAQHISKGPPLFRLRQLRNHRGNFIEYLVPALKLTAISRAFHRFVSDQGEFRLAVSEILKDSHVVCAVYRFVFYS